MKLFKIHTYKKAEIMSKYWKFVETHLFKFLLSIGIFVGALVEIVSAYKAYEKFKCIFYDMNNISNAASISSEIALVTGSMIIQTLCFIGLYMKHKHDQQLPIKIYGWEGDAIKDDLLAALISIGVMIGAFGTIIFMVEALAIKTITLN